MATLIHNKPCILGTMEDRMKKTKDNVVLIKGSKEYHIYLNGIRKGIVVCTTIICIYVATLSLIHSMWTLIIAALIPMPITIIAYFKYKTQNIRIDYNIARKNKE